MLPTPKFAKVLTQRAKDNPKVIKTSIPVKNLANTKPKKANTVRKKNSKDNSCKIMDILEINSNDVKKASKQKEFSSI